MLGVFSWLVSRRSGKLFAPGDYKNEDNYVKMQMAVVASLSAAATKDNAPASELRLHQIVETARGAVPAATGDNGWKGQILWVDDHPENNSHERQAFEAIGLRFTLALSTIEAVNRLSRTKLGAIISDMGRREGADEGYVLLDRIRREGDRTPFFVYSTLRSPEDSQEVQRRGGQGCTNNAQELFEMVTKAMIPGPIR